MCAQRSPELWRKQQPYSQGCIPSPMCSSRTECKALAESGRAGTFAGLGERALRLREPKRLQISELRGVRMEPAPSLPAFRPTPHATPLGLRSAPVSIFIPPRLPQMERQTVVWRAQSWEQARPRPAGRGASQGAAPLTRTAAAPPGSYPRPGGCLCLVRRRCF